MIDKSILISHKSSKNLIAILENLGYNVILSTDNPSIQSEVSDHPDMSVHRIDNVVVVDHRVYEYYRNVIPKSYHVLKSSIPLKADYPRDASLNVGTLENIYFHSNFTDPLLMKLYQKKGYKKITVKQGYANCSALKISSNSIITSDKGIHKIISSNGYKSFLITSGGILLPGYDTGFIGGCGFLLEEKKLILYGNPHNYKNCDEFMSIILENKIDLFYPEGEVFRDLGSMIKF